MSNKVIVVRVNSNKVIGIVKVGNMKAEIIRKFSSYEEASNFWDKCMLRYGIVTKLFFEEF